MTELTEDALRAALEEHPRREQPALPGRTNHLRTGVLVPVLWAPEPACIVTVRAAHLRHHAGEPCFPGGRPEPDDLDLRATALREAREELGIADAIVLGELSSVPLYTSDYRLHPFVASVPHGPLVPNAEVARVLYVELGPLLAGPSIDGIPWSHEGVSGLSPVFEVGGQRIFGGTAHVLYELLAVCARLLGRELPPLVPGRIGWSDVLPGDRS